MTTHTHKEKCGQRVPRLEKGLQRKRNPQLTNKKKIRTKTKNKDKSKEGGKVF